MSEHALESIISNLTKIGFHNVKPLSLAAMQASEKLIDVLKIMADLRAYFQGMTHFPYYYSRVLKLNTIASHIQTLCRQHRPSD